MQPSFIAGSKGQLFAAYFPPDPGTTCNGSVLCIPPFCEEMNRSRALMAEQARQFARRGLACLLFDLYGTGDSEGELEQADWDTWLQDTRTASAFLEERSGQVPVLWGIRLGALLGAQLAAQSPTTFPRMLWWHPVSDGKTYMTQMLRLRVATLVDRNKPPEKTNQMREALQQGESLEISGYVIPSALACAIDQVKLSELSLTGMQIDWLEPAEQIPGGVARASDALAAAGNQVKLQGVGAPAIWTLSERADASNFMSASLACLER
jgi:uncharacterized protein